MNSANPIILIDGECLLCQRCFQFILRKEKNNAFKFGFLQNKQIQEELKQRLNNRQLPDSLVLIDQSKIYLESTAALRIAKNLKFPINLFSIFLLLPSFLRDPIYRFIAKKRFHWFGRSEQCMVPDNNSQKRIISSLHL